MLSVSLAAKNAQLQGSTFSGAVAVSKAQVHDSRADTGLVLQGDRVGICMTQLDASLVERGIACTPGTVPTFTGAIIAVEKIRFFVGQVPSKLKVHVTVGHQTVMGDIQFFGLPDAAAPPCAEPASVMDRIDELTSKVSWSTALFECTCDCGEPGGLGVLESALLQPPQHLLELHQSWAMCTCVIMTPLCLKWCQIPMPVSLGEVSMHSHEHGHLCFCTVLCTESICDCTGLAGQS